MRIRISRCHILRRLSHHLEATTAKGEERYLAPTPGHCEGQTPYCPHVAGQWDRGFAIASVDSEAKVADLLPETALRNSIFTYFHMRRRLGQRLGSLSVTFSFFIGPGEDGPVFSRLGIIFACAGASTQECTQKKNVFAVLITRQRVHILRPRGREKKRKRFDQQHFENQPCVLR